MVSAVVYTIAYYLAMVVVLFGSAGRLDLPVFWAYTIVMILVSASLFVLLPKYNPGLIEERMYPGPGNRDRFSTAVLMLSLFASWAIAGLDVGRFHWSNMPIIVQLIGIAGYIIGLGISIWATLINPFFSSAIRIQSERGQYVVTTGPYKHVRHPGYVGGILFLIFSGVALGSLWSILPMILTVAAVIRRTIIEDRMLIQELAGYREYAQTVRYRLIPGLW